MRLTHTEFDAHLAAAIHEALGGADGEVDYTADLAGAGFDSFLLSNLVLAFEERIGREIPQVCLEAMADASNLSEVRDILQKTLVDGK